MYIFLCILTYTYIWDKERWERLQSESQQDLVADSPLEYKEWEESRVPQSLLEVLGG